MHFLALCLNGRLAVGRLIGICAQETSTNCLTACLFTFYLLTVKEHAQFSVSPAEGGTFLRPDISGTSVIRNFCLDGVQNPYSRVASVYTEKILEHFLVTFSFLRKNVKLRYYQPALPITGVGPLAEAFTGDSEPNHISQPLWMSL